LGAPAPIFGNGSPLSWEFPLVAKFKTSEPDVNPNPRVGIPPIPSGIQDHSFHTQAVFEIHKQVGKLESGLQGIENRLGRVETKLDLIAKDAAELKTTVDTIRPLLKAAVVGVWSAVGGVAAFGLVVFGMWLKHHNGW
jgi:hypothetical protein